MKTSPKIGTAGEQRFVVEAHHAIDFAQGGMPAVLSTPCDHGDQGLAQPLIVPVIPDDDRRASFGLCHVREGKVYDDDITASGHEEVR
jgi:hypothetical protein